MQNFGSDPSSPSSSGFSEPIKRLSDTNLGHWFHQYYQALCSYIVDYFGRIYLHFQVVREHKREERARWSRLTVDYDAALRAVIGEAPHKEREVAALCTARREFDISVFESQSTERLREKMARAGLRLDEVPYPALWLEGLVWSTEELLSLPGLWARSWGMESLDVVSWLSWLSPLNGLARLWEWFWTTFIKLTLMIAIAVAQGLFLRALLGPGIALTIVFSQMILVCCIFGWT